MLFMMLLAKTVGYKHKIFVQTVMTTALSLEVGTVKTQLPQFIATKVQRCLHFPSKIHGPIILLVLRFNSKKYSESNKF